MPLIEPGKKAPAFVLTDQNGKTHRLADYAGRPFVLLFLPERRHLRLHQRSVQLRDNLPQFKSSKAAVLGVSILDQASKARFANKYDLNSRCSRMPTTRWPTSMARGRSGRCTDTHTWAWRARRI